MTIDTSIWLSLLIFVAALLYSSVGHGGASGYLAAMALFGVAPAVMKPTALLLNVLVAGLGWFKFYRAGRFSWPLIWPFMVTSIPFALIGGSVTLPFTWYRIVVGIVLLYAAVMLVVRSRRPAATPPTPPRLPGALATGAALGLLSGLTGVGGGIFLTPLLLLMNWTEMRVAAGVSALFILLNSISGLLGQFLSGSLAVPTAIAYWAVAAVAGGLIGAELGSRRLNTNWLRTILSVVLVIAGLKLMLT